MSDPTKVILSIDRDAMNGIGLDRNGFESQALADIYNFVATHVVYSTYHSRDGVGNASASQGVPYVTWMSREYPIIFGFGPEAQIHLRMCVELWQTLHFHSTAFEADFRLFLQTFLASH